MLQSRRHYERAFTAYLTKRGVHHLSVADARELLPERARLTVSDDDQSGHEANLKACGYALYPQHGIQHDNGRQENNRPHSQTVVLVDVKGRKLNTPQGRPGRLENWVTEDDIASLAVWRNLVRARQSQEPAAEQCAVDADEKPRRKTADGPKTGPENRVQAGFVFLYWCQTPPVGERLNEAFEHDGKWYGLRAVTLDAYIHAMQPRSARWRTVNVPGERFDEISGTLAGAWRGGLTPRATAARFATQQSRWRA